ncbi:glycosyl transferase family 36 [candidate division KSB1 bacterium]|nr:glycosyl transferase family 36 [candidate division KSB1 bacterium]
MQYGNFRKDGKEYIIENVATPRPWINYLYNEAYFSTISNNGGGISYHKYPLHGRITRYRINDVPYDRPGKYIYIKDDDTGEIWSLTWQPVGRHLEAYRVTHGFGYTRVTAKVEGIDSDVLFFVPLDEQMEIWKTVLRNDTNRIRNLSIFSYVEFSLGHALIDLINQCDDQHFNRVYFDEKLNSLFATKTYWVTENTGTQQQENKAWDQWVFFTSNHPIVSYETLRERFIGPYRNEQNPIAIERGILSCKDTDFGNAVGALHVKAQIKPGDRAEVVFYLGIIPKPKFEDRKTSYVRKYHDINKIDAALSRINDKWKNMFSHVTVQTPDESTNIFLNYWTPYQARVAFDVGRVASFYYWGISRGFGFRDMAQDTLAVTIAEPDRAKERISLLARQMFRTGRVYHHFYRDGQGETTRHCDDPLWFILAVTDYIKETGDFSILEQVEPYVDDGEGTIRHHLASILGFVENNLGKHHLPIFGRGDWNDTLDYIGGDTGGESVWGGMFYVVMLNHLMELLQQIDDQETYQRTEKIRDKIRDAVDRYCWDGEWFIRAFGANDIKIGSKGNKYGKIFLNTQTWAVISQISSRDRLLTAMDSVKKYLDTKFGPKICAPAYRDIDPNIGLITRCVAGKKENAAVFCHPTTWTIQAECMMGRGNQAYTYYKKLLPNSVDSDIYQSEPYVYPQYVTSDEHETAGMASHSWQTGTAAWMYRVAIDYILGIRATYHGLLVDPVVPSHWREFSIERDFRGTRYIVHVKNPDGIERGIKAVYVEGHKIDSNILPISHEPMCKVDVMMG